MGMHSKSLAFSTEDHIVRVATSDRWSSTPGVIPAKVVEKRRARNKAARRSRAKNR